MANTLIRNTCRSKKFTDKAYNRREVFGQNSGRFWPSHLPEIHVVQKNSQIKRTIAERFSGKNSGRFWPTLLPEIHVVLKNSQIKHTIAERFTGKKVAVFGQFSYQKYTSSFELTLS